MLKYASCIVEGLSKTLMSHSVSQLKTENAGPETQSCLSIRFKQAAFSIQTYENFYHGKIFSGASK
jgi:hypothetical protein